MPIKMKKHGFYERYNQPWIQRVYPYPISLPAVDAQYLIFQALQSIFSYAICYILMFKQLLSSGKSLRQYILVSKEEGWFQPQALPLLSPGCIVIGNWYNVFNLTGQGMIQSTLSSQMFNKFLRKALNCNHNFHPAFITWRKAFCS